MGVIVRWTVRQRMLCGAVVLALGLFAPLSAAAQGVLTAGLLTPFKMTRTPGGNVVLAESGSGADDGRVSLISRWGRSYTLLSGLPSVITFEGSASGPTGIAQAHRTVYVVLGIGDTIGASVPPNELPNTVGPESPLVSSVLRARFDPVPDGIREGFALSAADLRSLADGHEVSLDNDSGEHVSLLLLTDFRDLETDPDHGIRGSNPFAAEIAGTLTPQDLVELGYAGATIEAANNLARLQPETPLGRRLEERSKLYIVDSGYNTVVEVDAATGRWRTVVRFPPFTNPLFGVGLGGPVTDAVPTGVFVRADGDLLVTTFTGFPFPPGVSTVYLVHPASGTFEPFLDSLTNTTDVLEVGDSIYVLELSTDFLGSLPGQVLRFPSAGGAPTVVAGGLIGGTGLEYDPRRNELLVSETFTGRIIRVPLAP